MADFENFDDLDQQIAEENAKNNRFHNLLQANKDGDTILFRFLKEALPAKTFKSHGHYDEKDKTASFQAVCANEIGKPCHYCAEYERTGDKKYKTSSFLVYPVFIVGWTNPKANADGQAYIESQIGKEKLWLIKLHFKQTLHVVVRDYMKRSRSALTAEWQLSRRGEGKNNTTYALSGFPINDAPLPQWSAEQVWALLLETLPPKVSDDETETRTNVA